MFDTYLSSQTTDTRRQKLLMASAIVTLIGTIIGLFFIWFAGKMSISRVSPPTLEFVLVQFALDGLLGFEGPQDLVMVAGLSLVFGMLAALYPARRAVKIKPLEALRR